jgi:phosphoribosylglycinamide formyltransferase-1
MTTRVGVLIAGAGSNLQALIDVQAPDGAYAIVAVAANNPDAYGLTRARAAGITATAIDHRPFGKDREAFERALDAWLRAEGVEFIALAGFMRVLSPFFVRAWAGRMINIHPSLLPLFPGLNTHARALEAGVKLHGCSVHWVNEGVDAGAIIGQAGVPVLPGDTPDTLGARVLGAEHRLYPACLSIACARGGERSGGEAPFWSAWIS